ncbi:glycoside hydrolase N-terminal domain-containing protein [Prevotella sp. 10(H)]|uniref:glycoside hydrolase family 95 protein n=1 Tax=Prevotella sp. 10(H) TaxID=1158294 RepID=UPI0012DF14E3|nr:glycoside hydrolase family 95 protein [Prevotella sp. 10(H)]
MKNIIEYLLFALVIILPYSCNTDPINQDQKDSVNKLWYSQPAKEWMESLPLGNGRMGITAFGGVEDEMITLNEITLWAGQYNENMHRKAGKKVVDEIRQAFFDGNYKKGNDMATEHLAGNGELFGSHVPLGNLIIKQKYASGEVSDYKRELNLYNSIHTTSFKKGDINYTREYFCSNPDDIFIALFSADKSNSINFSLSFDMYRDAAFVPTQDGIEFSGQVSFRGLSGVHFQGNLGLKLEGGAIEINDKTLEIKDATKVLLAFDIRTDYSNDQYQSDTRNTVKKALNQEYNTLKERHIADYQNLYNRAELYLGDSPHYQLPTDERWKKVKEGNNDIGIDALFFNYARYLIIAASRENSPLPANLQGIWNDNLANNMGWANDYHLDINTQQNYWLTNVGNLQELNAPLFRYIEHLAEHGAKTANDVYGANGWTAHTIANVWGYTACGGGVNWGLFPLASSWIATHLWTQYEYTQDKEFLRKQAYPLLKSNAEFLLDYMVKHPQSGYLVAGPSTSPENSFLYKGDNLSVSMGTTADRQLAYEIFTACIKAAEILDTDSDFRKELEDARASLSPMLVGKNGGLQEWYEDLEEAQPNHRHTTHLLGFYPFNQISYDKTPELVEAVKKTIDLRLNAKDWEDVEWSRANMICMYARLLDAEKAYESVVGLQREFTRENLLTISPEGIAGAPYDLFIFDGNEAGAAGIAEMLLQSQNGYIEFLPALPAQWHTGYFKGLCVKGGAHVDLNWKDGKIRSATITATANNTFNIKTGSQKEKYKLNKQSINPDIKDKIVNIPMSAGDVLEIIYTD